MTASQAWRLVTNNYDRHRDGVIVASGDDAIVDALLRTRAIVGHAK
jgi:hypothetical protein